MHDTLKYHKNRPLQTNLDLSGASLKHVMGQYAALKTNLVELDYGVKQKPESDALWFYVQQHAMGLIQRTYDDDEPLGEAHSFVKSYHNSIQQKSLRMFYYLLLICTRESRHMGSGSYALFQKFPAMENFHANHIQDKSHDDAIKAITDNAPDVTLGEYTEFLYRAFTIPKYGSQFGGKAWARIAKPLRDFVHGKISAEILMDTAFTLAHNNGAIFNKGMLYDMYNNSALTLILDVQRSGQIPQLIANPDSIVSSYITNSMHMYVEEFATLNPDFGGRVDWTQVKSIGGVPCYYSQINAQKSEEKNTSFMGKLAAVKAQAEAKKAQAEAKLAQEKAQAAKLALLKGSFEIMPGVLVAKGKRSQL
jgi:hypothetical protein